ncbi:hypothetical protein Bca101_049199 [Brassica carinata]
MLVPRAVLNRSLYFQVQIEAPRDVTHQLEYPEVGVTELTLSNGMQVCYKSTDFLDDQVLFTGFAYGGLSELPESDYISCSMGSTIAGEIGMFGYKPSMLMDMLAGGDIGCGSGDEFIIFPPSGRVEDKQTKIFRLSLCQTSSYNTTSVGLAYSHVNTSFSPRKCVAAYRLEKYLEAQFIDMKIVEILRLAKER